jgi:hypothetical protein
VGSTFKVSINKTVANFDGNSLDMLEYWKVFLASLEQQIFKVYVQKRNGRFLGFSRVSFQELSKQVRSLYYFYCFLVFKLLKQNYDIGIKTRVFTKSFSNNLKKLQQRFIESSVIRLDAIIQVNIFDDSQVPKGDPLTFVSLVKQKWEFFNNIVTQTGYFKSLKNFKVKNDSLKVAALTKRLKKILTKGRARENSTLCLLLLNKFITKRFVKKYCSETVYRV